jgi:hypothetical protein
MEQIQLPHRAYSPSTTYLDGRLVCRRVSRDSVDLPSMYDCFELKEIDGEPKTRTVRAIDDAQQGARCLVGRASSFISQPVDAIMYLDE